MITITLQQAKAKLNHLVEKARSGEQIVLMRGSKIVATITPLSEEDLEIKADLSDLQAEKFWKEIAEQKKKKFRSMQAAVKYLKNR